MSNLLSSVINLFSQVDNPYTFSWIGKAVQWIIEKPTNMGVGIILFTLALKLLTLPLDIISRASMKKNNMKMERIRPQLEKLQRQYANNQAIYNQKIQALYKKEGYSAFSSCLPTIVTMVVFIIVINQFSNYSSYKNLWLIEGMVDSYNNAVVTYDDTHGTDLVVEKDGVYYFNYDQVPDIKILRDGNIIQKVDGEENAYKTVDIYKFVIKVDELNRNGYNDVKISADGDIKPVDGGGYAFNLSNFKEGTTEDEVNKIITTKVCDYLASSQLEGTVIEAARKASAEFYRENVPKFLWVKNIWESDLPWKHPVKENFSDYQFTERKGCSAKPLDLKISEDQYQELTYYLGEEKSGANGYLILVVLSIGVMVLSQIIMNKTQKAQLELQSADGQAAQTSKMMTWMMPIMFGVFSFIYTASFSLYMVISSLLSTASTLIINYFVEKKFNKQIEEEVRANDKRYHKNNNKSGDKK